MKGVLWKWTNYWSSWQTRWFVLENGILSYYKSQDTVNQGCKGSVKLTACQINVHPIDATRLDIVIPGEQHMYLKAATSQERQRWLVALGTAKACINSRPYDNSLLKYKKSELKLYCDLLMQHVQSVKNAANNKNGPEIQKIDDAANSLSATCDTFIKTLEECMKLSNESNNHLDQIFDPSFSTLPVPVVRQNSNTNNSHSVD